jgi:hypothetical protein
MILRYNCRRHPPPPSPSRDAGESDHQAWFCYLPLELVRALFSSKAGMLNGFYMHMRNALNLESTAYIWSYMAILISFF